MDYRLSIKVNYTNDDKYKKLLDDYEFPRQYPLSVTFEISNIGTGTFNGWIEKINLIYVNHIEPISVPIDSNQKTIVNLSSQNVKTYKSEIFAPVEGFCWLECIITSNNVNEDRIEYFANNIHVGNESWRHLISIVNREQLEIILLLREIKEKLPSLNK